MSADVTTKPFLQELESAEKEAGGVYLFREFLPAHRAANMFETFDNDELFPWDLKPKLYGQELQQHAYKYGRSVREKRKFRGLAVLDQLCEEIEQRFDGKVTDVYCNRFKDPTHMIDWHTDTYGSHIFVLTLGSERTVEFREKGKDFVVEAVRPVVGDIYFMPLQINKTHLHRVCPADDNDGTAKTRISFVFFFQPPKYATEFKISWKDHLRGFGESLIS